MTERRYTNHLKERKCIYFYTQHSLRMGFRKLNKFAHRRRYSAQQSIERFKFSLLYKHKVVRNKSEHNRTDGFLSADAVLRVRFLQFYRKCKDLVHRKRRRRQDNVEVIFCFVFLIAPSSYPNILYVIAMNV